MKHELVTPHGHHLCRVETDATGVGMATTKVKGHVVVATGPTEDAATRALIKALRDRRAQLMRDAEAFGAAAAALLAILEPPEVPL